MGHTEGQVHQSARLVLNVRLTLSGLTIVGFGKTAFKKLTEEAHQHMGKREEEEQPKKKVADPS